MNRLSTAVSANGTNFLRTDHRAVSAAFRPFSTHLRPGMKQKLGEAVCLALINHTRLEEEIFYPAVRSIAPDIVEKSIPEHAELARLIALLRRTAPTDPQYDVTLAELKRKVEAHVEEEERELFPRVERELDAERNNALGARMSGRRIELASPMAGALLLQLRHSLPSAKTLGFLAAVVLAGVLASRTGSRSRYSRYF